MKSLVTTLMLLAGFANLLAQPQLALLKKDKIITRFEEGEYIRFLKKGDEGFTRAIIVGIHPGFFIVGEDTIYAYDVEKIDISKKGLTTYKVAPIGIKLIEAGTLLILADVFNKTVILDSKYEIDNPVTAVALGTIGAGAFMQVVNNNYFKISHKKKLATLNIQ